MQYSTVLKLFFTKSVFTQKKLNLKQNKITNSVTKQYIWCYKILLTLQ